MLLCKRFKQRCSPVFLFEICLHLNTEVMTFTNKAWKAYVLILSFCSEMNKAKDSSTNIITYITISVGHDQKRTSDGRILCTKLRNE